MKREIISKCTAIILAFLVIFNGLNLISSGQTRRRTAAGSGPSNPPAAKAPETGFRDQKTTSPLASPWKSGTLPQPLPIPAGNTDEVAAALAKKVSVNDGESASALMTALQLSGFSVINRDGSAFVTPPDGKGQGLGLAGWEFASMAKMQGEKRSLDLKTFDGAIRKAIPEFRGIEIGKLILEGIQGDATDQKNPYLRFCARFIVELGKNSETPYDILNGAAVEQVGFSPAQAQLTLRRLYGDLYAYGKKMRLHPRPQAAVQRGEAQFLNASYTGNSGLSNGFAAAPEFMPEPAASASSSPCQLQGDAPVIIDAAASTLGAGREKVVDLLEKAYGESGEKWIGGYANFLSGINIILAYLKFMQTYASMEIKLSSEGGPLVRTKNSIPGGRKNLRARVVLEIGNWQMFNCLRLGLLVMFGPDFSTFSNGPLGGAGVTWHLDQGGGSDIYHNSTGRTGNEQFVGFTSGSATVQKAGTGFGPVASATYSRTNDDGVATAILEGSPQKYPKLGKLFEVPKTAVVRVTVKAKAPDLKGDLVDVFGAAAGLIGGPAALLQLPTELLYSADWASSEDLAVPVIDWEECTGAWSGTITYTSHFEFHDSKVEKRNSGRGTDERDFFLTADYTANVNVTASDKKDGSSVARATVESTVKSTENALAVEKNYCQHDRQWHDMNGLFKNVSETKGTGEVSANVNVGMNADGTYSIQLSTDQITAKATGKLTGSYSGQCWEKPFEEKTSGPTPTTLPGKSITSDIMPGDPSNRDHLSGSFSPLPALGQTQKISWNLYRCQGTSQRADAGTFDNSNRELAAGQKEVRDSGNRTRGSYYGRWSGGGDSTEKKRRR